MRPISLMLKGFRGIRSAAVWLLSAVLPTVLMSAISQSYPDSFLGVKVLQFIDRV